MSRKKFTPKKNPRFVWNVGAIAEQYPDMALAINIGTVLWDRQDKRPVITVHGKYQQAFCLETTRSPEDMPFTTIETWFNNMSNKVLISEGIPPTK